jgi:hypothetical protein
VHRHARHDDTCGTTIHTVRGYVDVDIVIEDTTRQPHTLILCECKHWKRKIPKSVVHAFRTVVQDSGASIGYVISEQGFQTGATAAAATSNVRLVTWKRWFTRRRAQLMLLADHVYALADSDVEKGTRTLMAEAVNTGHERAWEESQQLGKRYFELLFASSEIAPGGFDRFPRKGIDPRSATERTITFASARDYFEILFEAAPQAVADYSTFLMKYTDGRMGAQEVFDETIIDQIREGTTTMEDVKRRIARGSGIHCRPDGETWSFHGSITRFRRLRFSKTGRPVSAATTRFHSLTIEFGPDEVARRVTLEKCRRTGPPRP